MISTEATPQDIEKFYRGGFKYETKAFLVRDGNDILMIGGFIFRDGLILIFFDSAIERGSFRFKRGLAMLCKYIKKSKKYNMPVYAFPDEEIEGSEVLLKHLDFKDEGDLWRYHYSQ